MTASFRFSKTPQIEPFLAFLMNFCPLKMLDLIKEFLHFLTIFDLFKVTYLVTLFDCKLQFFKNLSKFTIFGIFNELLSPQNVNLKCRMRLFSVIFKHCEVVPFFSPTVPCTKACYKEELWRSRRLCESCGFAKKGCWGLGILSSGSPFKKAI